MKKLVSLATVSTVTVSALLIGGAPAMASSDVKPGHSAPKTVKVKPAKVKPAKVKTVQTATVTSVVEGVVFTEGSNRYIGAAGGNGKPGEYRYELKKPGEKWAVVSTVTSLDGMFSFDVRNETTRVERVGGAYVVRVIHVGGGNKGADATVKTVTVKVPEEQVQTLSQTLNPVTVYTSPGGARWLQVSGAVSNLTEWGYMKAWVTRQGEEQHVGPEDSTVNVETDGSFAHGRTWFKIPRGAGTYTVTSQVITANGVVNTATQNVTVEAAQEVSTRLDEPTVYVDENGSRYLQVAGSTTGYGEGALNLVSVINNVTGEPTPRGKSGVWTAADGSYVHGKWWFELPAQGGTFRVVATTNNDADEVSEDSRMVTVDAVEAPYQELNPIAIISVDGVNYVQVSGFTTGYPADNTLWSHVVITDADGNQVGRDSAVNLESDGSFYHGKYWLELPSGPGRYTVTSTIGSGTMATVATVDIAV